MARHAFGRVRGVLDEARKYGVRSAMPAMRAERLCPDAVFIAPDFTRYRAVSNQVREIFHDYTDLVEPLSLDEAYLDVTENKRDLSTATAVAEAIRENIFERTALTASAGVAPCKFLAKIASDWRKPNGIFVIKPHHVIDFLDQVPVAKLPGVGKKAQQRLDLMGVTTVKELRAVEFNELSERFGKFGRRLYNLARGIDRSEVRADRPVKSISSEHTFSHDLRIDELKEGIETAVAQTWRAAQKKQRRGRTVVLKLKTAEFKNITRSVTPASRPLSEGDLLQVALELLERVGQSESTRYRLVGVGLSNFIENDPDFDQPALFEDRDFGNVENPA